MSTLAERLNAVSSAVADAARSAGRTPEDVTIIVVTKFQPAALVRDLYSLGVRNVGEGRHQEASQKAADLVDLSLTWHFVGQLQTKKARAVAEYADVIHSIDRPSVVAALANIQRRVSCFIQVNLTEDPARGGVAADGFDAVAEDVLNTPTLELLGVMAVAPLGEEPLRAFARLRASSERLQTIAPSASAISAGMSQDYSAAIAEGATHLRIGTAITGNRPVPG